jgi:hypothetical protein
MNGTLSKLCITAEYTDDENTDKRIAHYIELPITGLPVAGAMELEAKFKSLYCAALAYERALHGRKPT